VAKKHNPRVPNLHFYRGDVLARLGRNEEAEREFRQEIKDYPASPDAYTSLILLFASSGRAQDATQLVYDLLKAAPHANSYVVISETLSAVGDSRGALYWAYQGVRKFPDDRELRTLLQQMRSGAAHG